MIWLWIILVVVGVVVLPVMFRLLYESLKVYKRRLCLAKLHGPAEKGFMGSLHLIPKPGADFLKFFRALPSKYPECCRLNLGPHRSHVFVYHPKTVKAILKTSEPKHTSNLGPYSLLRPWLGNGLLVNSGPSWFRNRRLLTSAFHFDILKPYMQTYNSCADILVNKWLSKIQSTPTFDVYKDISLCTLNVIMRCAFSYEEDIQLAGATHPYVQSVQELAKLTQRRALSHPWKQIDSLYKFTSDGKAYKRNCDYVHQVADHMINKRKQILHQLADDMSQSHPCRDFLDILLLARDEEGVGMTDLQIRQEVDTFLFAGHDTTASAITWLVYSLAKHPEYQDRARAEVDALGGGDITWEDLHRLPYLAMCIKECLRRYSPVPGISRELTKPMTLNGVELLPGTAVNIYIDALHHNPAVWGDDHMEYKPDRFLPENVENMDSHAFCPFSAGSRNCIGQNFAMNEEKVLIAKLLQKFTFHISPESVDVVEMPILVMRSMTGVHITFTPRT